LIVIDDIVHVGTANFDMRSLFVNVEVMLRIDDAGFARQMRDFLDGLRDDCEIVTAESHKARAGWLTRLRWTLAWFVVGVADYTVSRRLNFGLAETDPETEI
ncbi:MAG: phospholipase D-like domain-containing protein, partial [Sphingopyxis sp.]